MWPYTSEEQSFLEPSAAGALMADRPNSSPSGAAAFDEQPSGELATRTLAMPADTNPAGDMFGGWIMSQMDNAAAITASNRANGRVVTVAVDAISFLRPVKVGDVVCCYTHVERVGLSSIYLRVQAWTLRQGRGERVKVSEAGFTFVALDAEGKPRAVERAPASTPAARSTVTEGAVDIGPMGVVKRVYLAWAQYRAFEAALARYRALPQRELLARGLTPSDLIRVAYEEAEKAVEASQAKRGKQKSPLADNAGNAGVAPGRHATA